MNQALEGGGVDFKPGDAHLLKVTNERVNALEYPGLAPLCGKGFCAHAVADLNHPPAGGGSCLNVPDCS
jgi:hypothetical protein